MSNVFPIDPAENELERALRILDDLTYLEAGKEDQAPVVAYDADERARIDQNLAILEQAVTRTSIPARVGSEARIDPDDIRLFWVTLGLTGFFATAAFAASFAGQLAMAENTYLPTYLRFLVPLFIDLPIIVVSLAILIFRRRRQSTVASWILLGALTATSSTINAVHVLSQAGVLGGAALTLPVLLGAGVMAAAPILVLVAWEELARLAVKPLPEKE